MGEYWEAKSISILVVCLCVCVRVCVCVCCKKYERGLKFIGPTLLCLRRSKCNSFCT